MDPSEGHCLTCFHSVDGDNFRCTADPEICGIIRKHFWFAEIDLVDALICPICWDCIDRFHRVYVAAEQLYEQKEVLILDDEKPIKKENTEVFLVETEPLEDFKEELDSDFEGESDLLPDPREEVSESVEVHEELVEEMKEESERENDDEEEEEEDSEDAADNEEEEVPEGDDPDQFIRQHVILNCDQCDASDFTFKGMTTHLQKVHKLTTRPFVSCCGIRYHTRLRLVEHVQYVLDPTTFKCDQCSKVQYFTNRPALKRHLQVRHKVHFPKRAYNLTNRHNKVKPPQQKSEEQIKRQEELEKRRQDRLEEDKMMRDHVQFGCIPCGTTFESYTELFKHTRVQHKQKPIVLCCGNRFHNRPRLLQHIQSIVNPVAFRCDMCFRCFQSDYARNKHVAEMHPTDDSVKYQCDRCPKWFVREIKYRKHMQDHEDCDKGEIKCEHCGKLYKSRHILYMHIRNKHQDPRFVCDICAKPFHLQSEFKKHKLQHEDPDQLKMQCQHCLKWLKNREYWRAHIRLHVVGEIKCEICGRVTPNRVAYRSHKKNAHGARNQKCEWCGKCFNKAITLREHVASRHTGATLYKCRFCPKTFNSNANMHSHQKKMHPVEWQAARVSAAASNEPASVAAAAMTAAVTTAEEFEGNESEDESFDT